MKFRRFAILLALVLSGILSFAVCAAALDYDFETNNYAVLSHTTFAYMRNGKTVYPTQAGGTLWCCSSRCVAAPDPRTLSSKAD
jgi:hypothetical protein